MSIIAAAAQLDANFQKMMAVLTALSLTAAALSGVFRRRGVLGPPRWALHETSGLMLLMMLFGVGAWAGVQLCYGAVIGVRPPPAIVAPATTSSTSSSTQPIATQPATTQSSTSSKIAPADLVRISALSALAAFVALLAANAFARKDGLRRLGIDGGSFAKAIPIALLGIVIVLPLMTWASVLTQALWEALHWEHANEHDLLQILGNSDSASLRRWIILSAIVFAPLAEETMFRGHLQTMFTMLLSGRRQRSEPAVSGLLPADASTLEYFNPVVSDDPDADARREAIGRWMAIVITSILFASIHPWWSTPAIFFLSLCLGYAYERTANLWVPILLHAMFNASSVWFYLYTMHPPH